MKFDSLVYYGGQKILAVIVCHFKKNCNPYFIVIMSR
jgi:hypothetical protein